jgi:hypothetical protein
LCLRIRYIALALTIRLRKLRILSLIRYYQKTMLTAFNFQWIAQAFCEFRIIQAIKS